MGDDPSSVAGPAAAGRDDPAPTGTGDERTARPDDASGDGDEHEPELIEELLVEEISIDGMCGVY